MIQTFLWIQLPQLKHAFSILTNPAPLNLPPPSTPQQQQNKIMHDKDKNFKQLLKIIGGEKNMKI